MEEGIVGELVCGDGRVGEAEWHDCHQHKLTASHKDWKLGCFPVLGDAVAYLAYCACNGHDEGSNCTAMGGIEP
eukprot:5969505-Ditylum_brightwellii.AAC.1